MHSEFDLYFVWQLHICDVLWRLDVKYYIFHLNKYLFSESFCNSIHCFSLSCRVPENNVSDYLAGRSGHLASFRGSFTNHQAALTQHCSFHHQTERSYRPRHNECAMMETYRQSVSTQPGQVSRVPVRSDPRGVALWVNV